MQNTSRWHFSFFSLSTKTGHQGPLAAALAVLCQLSYYISQHSCVQLLARGRACLSAALRGEDGTVGIDMLQTNLLSGSNFLVSINIKVIIYFFFRTLSVIQISWYKFYCGLLLGPSLSPAHLYTLL